MDHIAQEIARTLLEVGCVSLRPDKLFTWASGIRSPVYCDNRILISDVGARRKIRDAFIHRMKEKNLNPELIAGVATGAIPHAAWLAEHLNKPMVYIRAEPKEHGKENIVEGRVKPGVETIVIEDLVSTGGSSCLAVEAVRKAGAKVHHCLAIFSYGFEMAQKRFADIKCSLTPLTDFSTLLQTAKESRMITAEQVQLIRKFIADPKHWQEKK